MALNVKGAVQAAYKLEIALEVGELYPEAQVAKVVERVLASRHLMTLADAEEPEVVEIIRDMINHVRQTSPELFED